MKNLWQRYRRWAWLKTNKKAPTRRSAIWFLVVLCSVPGMAFGACMELALLESPNVLVFLGVVVIAVAGFVVLAYESLNNIKGYYDVDILHESAVRHWEKTKTFYEDQKEKLKTIKESEAK